jgi:hypothetical protein
MGFFDLRFMISDFGFWTLRHALSGSQYKFMVGETIIREEGCFRKTSRASKSEQGDLFAEPAKKTHASVKNV